MNGTRVFGPRCPLSVRTSPPSPTGTQTRARVPSRSASAKRHSPGSSRSPVAPLAGPPEPRDVRDHDDRILGSDRIRERAPERLLQQALVPRLREGDEETHLLLLKGRLTLEFP